ncbi:hypothetical protein AAY473_007242 [Plecturocebus cupreus]
MGFHYAGQAGLKLLISSDPRASASQSAGVTGVSHHARQHLRFLCRKADPEISDFDAWYKNLSKCPGLIPHSPLRSRPPRPLERALDQASAQPLSFRCYGHPASYLARILVTGCSGGPKGGAGRSGRGGVGRLASRLFFLICKMRKSD